MHYTTPLSPPVAAVPTWCSDCSALSLKIATSSNVLRVDSNSSVVLSLSDRMLLSSLASAERCCLMVSSFFRTAACSARSWSTSWALMSRSWATRSFSVCSSVTFHGQDQ